MIHTHFFRDKATDTLEMEMQGHAETAPKGQDLVCAAATMLAYTLAQSVQFLYEQGQFLEKPSIQLMDGYARIVAQPKPEALAETLMAYWVTQEGAFVLERNYPGALSLMTMEV